MGGGRERERGIERERGMGVGGVGGILNSVLLRQSVMVEVIALFLSE